MKKIIFALAVLFAAASISSCQKEPIGGTKIQSLAGQWYVTADAVDASGKVLYEDPYDAGRFMLLTYNTSANTTTDLLIDDLGNFWEFKVKANADIASKSFSVDKAANMYYDSNVTVTGGKIVENGATTPSGQPADYIEFFVVFSDDKNVPAEYASLKFSGYRYTGFTNDD